MKVFFTASYAGKKKYQDIYDHVVNCIRRNSAEVISKEVQEYGDLLDERLLKSPKKKVHYTYVKKGINLADAVIIEASDESFQLGHEATLAVMYNKPVLCLANVEVAKSLEIYQPGFAVVEYRSKDDLNQIISKFINDVQEKYLSVRLHIHVSANQKNFLDWYSKKNGTNNSQVIRDQINKLIDENPDYYDSMSKVSQNKYL